MAMMVVCVLGFWIGFWWAYLVTTNRILHQCRRLGGFYIGGTVFKVTELKEPMDPSETISERLMASTAAGRRPQAPPMRNPMFPARARMPSTPPKGPPPARPTTAHKVEVTLKEPTQ